MNMESNYELKEINIKNKTCYYFGDVIKIEDFDFDNILYEIVLVYNISCKTLIGAKPLHIRFDEVDQFIRVDDRSKYFVLFEPENCAI